MTESLACKYRPKSFEECIGQPAIISILSRQISTKTFKSAYLFTGPSGCGKTSVARIMANEINGFVGSPIEIDAASNNGIDSIRAIINDARQSSIESDYKIYILDECHAFSNSAWQALLKLIEEPPYNTIFILCTTNPDKIPDTIMTRVQRFDFKKISYSEIADRLEFILNEEFSIKYDRESLERIALESNGLMREAISLLDKCISYGDLTITNVESVLGLVKYTYLFDILDNINYKNSSNVFNVLHSISLSINYFNLFNTFLNFLIDCHIYCKTGDISISKIPSNYEDRIIKDFDYSSVIDRVYKFKRLVTEKDAEQLFNILIIELTRGD